MKIPYADLRAAIGNCNNQGIREFRGGLPNYWEREELRKVISQINNTIERAQSGGIQFERIAPCQSLEQIKELTDYLKGKIDFEDKRVPHCSSDGELVFSHHFYFPKKAESDRESLLNLLINSPINPDSIPQSVDVLKSMRERSKRMQWDANLYFL